MGEKNFAAFMFIGAAMYDPELKNIDDNFPEF